MSGGNGSPGRSGPSSYGSTGCVVLRIFFFVRPSAFFFGVVIVDGVSAIAASGGEASAIAASGGAGVVELATAFAELAGVAGDASGAIGVIDADDPLPAAGFAAGGVAEEPAAGFTDGDDADDEVAEVDDRPSTSMYVPAPASARSTSSTATIKPTRRFGGGAIDIDGSSLGFGRCEVGCTLCADAGDAPFGCAGTDLLGGRCTLGVSGYDAGGTFCGPLGCRGS